VEPTELSPDDRVMPLEELPPGGVAESRHQLGRPDDVREVARPRPRIRVSRRISLDLVRVRRGRTRQRPAGDFEPKG
jgi:hypothetical protein